MGEHMFHEYTVNCSDKVDRQEQGLCQSNKNSNPV